MKTVMLKVENRWLDSYEKARLIVKSPTGKTIAIYKKDLFGVKLSERVDATMGRFVRGTKMFDVVDFVSNTDEMKDLLSIAKRMW